MPRKKKTKRDEALPVGVGPQSVPGTSQQAASSGARQQPVSSGARQQPVSSGARQQPVSSGARQQPVSAPRQHISPTDVCQQMSDLSLGDSQSSSARAVDVSKPKWQQIEPEKIGFEFRKKRTTPMPTKPGINKLGRPIKLISNCYSLKIPSGNVYHYDVEIFNTSRKSTTTVEKKISSEEKKNKCLNTKCNRRVFERMVETCEDFKGVLPVYDGRKNMYTRHPLKFLTDKYTRRVVLPDPNPSGGSDEVFWVDIKPVRKKDSNDCAISLDPLHALFSGRISSVPREVIMAIETVLKHSPCLRHIPLGQSFFYPPKYPTPLGNCKEIWPGYHQSVRLGQKTPMVNLDVSASTFFQNGPLLRYVATHLDCDVEGLHRVTQVHSQVMKPLSDMLRNLQVEVTHLRGYRRKYRIARLTELSASRLDFEIVVDGRKVRKTVAQHFAERHRHNVRFPNLPCVQMLPDTKNLFFPIEVCEVVQGQRYNGILQGEETAKMVKDTSFVPRDRFKEINFLVQEKAKFPQDRYLREFNISVCPDPLRLEGRQLSTPAIAYHTPSHDSIVRPQKGSWNMMNKKFLNGASVRSWALVSFSDLPLPMLQKFAGDLLKFGGIHGMYLDKCREVSLAPRAPPRNVEHFDDYVGSIFQNLKRKYQIELVVFVNQSDRRNARGGEDLSKALYRTAKDVASKMDIVSQCVKPDNVRRANPSLVCNILLKINAKMGGTNCSLIAGELPSFMREPIMFVGADVTHPSPTGDIPCSVAAVVGSLDDKISMFEVATRAQVNEDDSKVSREVIVDMEGMMIELLTAFRNKNAGRMPVRIVMYRDGVSDGEFPEVSEVEVDKMRNACRKMSKDREIKLTYIVMQKRHHVRTMCEDSRDPAANKGNPPPGTVIDTVLTHPLNYDFFLYPHYGLQGTSRPAYHTVVNDDNAIKETDMHNMTNALSYIYARCTKSISSPSPARYAHLAAFTARQRLLKQKMQTQPHRRGPHDPNAPKLTRGELNNLNQTVIKVRFEDIV